jgi:choline kinase
MDQMSYNLNQPGRGQTAVLLAAGFGSRISGLTDRPKCLLPLNGKTLLEWHLETWIHAGIEQANLVLGYQKELIQEVANTYQDRITINYLFNDDYKVKGNTYSLWLGIKDIEGPSLIFDADLIYEPHILLRFLSSDQSDSILVGPGQLSDIESTKVLVDHEGLVRQTVDKRAVTKAELQRYQFVGEAIGVLKFSEKQTRQLASDAQEFLAQPDRLLLNWEHLLNLFLLNHPVWGHVFEEGKWIEIDTPEDYRMAQQLFKDEYGNERSLEI